MPKTMGKSAQRSASKSKTRSATGNGRANGATPEQEPAESVQQKADALYRCAAECCRQHRRYACLVDRGVSDAEQKVALTMVTMCDEHLVQFAQSYEKCCTTTETSHRTEEWWHKANSLWHAAREYARRHKMSDDDARQLATRDASKLRMLALEFDLEASALLGLQHALDAYKRVRPDADLAGCKEPV
jgi:hypothetical protein